MMMNRAGKLAAATSLGCLIVLLAMAIASVAIDPEGIWLTVTDGFHMQLTRRDLNVRMVFFNDAEDGPYRGSMMSVVGAEGDMYSLFEDEASFGDTAGIYYRYFRGADGTLWTLMISLWYPVALSAVLPAWWLLISHRRRRSRGVGEVRG